MNLELTRKKVNQLLMKKKILKSKIKDDEEELVKLQKEYKEIEQARDIIQTVAQNVQEIAHSKIANVVTRCLQGVFNDPYEFKIIFEKKRGRTEARLVFLRNRQELDPVTSSGGGCLDIAGIALRLSCLLLSKPYKRRLLILDEPFKNISPNYRPLIPELLIELSKELKVQIIMTTNFPEYICGKVIDLDK